VIVLRADNDGEGGILALLSLVVKDDHAERRLAPLLVLGVIGAALLYGDGAITPAISVLSAIEGLKVQAPSLAPAVVPLTVVILFGLFWVQKRGTGSLGFWFGPIMVAWFVAIGGLGVYGIIQSPAILAALDPSRAVRLVGHEPAHAVAVFGLAFLALTGAEALYADLGHFGRRPIRIAWFALVFPALVLNYFGQGGWVLAHPDATDNPFFKLVPSWLLLPMVILAAIATVIASQALISGVFSMTRQAIQMRLLARMTVTPTSGKAYGQIYVPFVNWVLMAVTILIVIGFRTSDNLANAYGIAVSATMLATTILLFRVMRDRWAWPLAPAAAVIGTFALIDAGFLAANSTKLFDGGWLPVAMGAFVVLCMLSWRLGTDSVHRALEAGSMSFDDFVSHVEELVVARIPGCGVFITRVAGRASAVILRQVEHNRVLHKHVVLMTLELTRLPRVPASQRIVVKELGHGFLHVVVKVGFMQRVDIPTALRGCAKLGYSFCSDVHYFIAHEGLVRRSARHRLPGLIWLVFSAMHRLGLRAADYLHLPPKRVMEVGYRLEV
jgi:KUP system potassium uptake protein